MKVKLIPASKNLLEPKNIVGELYAKAFMTDKGLVRLSIVLEKDKKDCLYFRIFSIVKLFSIVVPMIRSEEIYDLKCKETKVFLVMAEDKGKPFMIPTSEKLETLRTDKKVDKIIEAVINY